MVYWPWRKGQGSNMTRHFKTSYSAFYMLTIHTTRVYTLTKFYQNLFKCYHYRQKTCLPVLAKTTSLSEIKNNVVFSGFAFFTKCVPVLPVRGSHSFTGHQSFQNTFMSGKRRFLCLQMVYIGGSDTIKWLNYLLVQVRVAQIIPAGTERDASCLLDSLLDGHREAACHIHTHTCTLFAITS